MDPVAQLSSAVAEPAAGLAGNGRLGASRLDRPKRADFGDYSSNAAMLVSNSESLFDSRPTTITLPL